MKTFKKGEELLIANNEVQARAFKSAGFEEVEESPKVDTPKKGASSKK
mgnify:CR=1 FL=1